MVTSPITPESAARLMDEFPAAFMMPRGRGSAVEVQELVTDWGPLTAEHIQIAKDHFESGDFLGVNSGHIKALRFTHHRCAQLLAMGMDETKVAMLCNYTAQRVSHLKQDPAFAELLAYYANSTEEEFADFVSTAANLSMDFLHRLQQQLDETPEAFTPGTLLEAIRVLADRTGHAPVQKSLNVNVNADLGARLQAARGRLLRAQGSPE